MTSFRRIFTKENSETTIQDNVSDQFELLETRTQSYMIFLGQRENIANNTTVDIGEPFSLPAGTYIFQASAKANFGYTVAPTGALALIDVVGVDGAQLTTIPARTAGIAAESGSQFGSYIIRRFQADIPKLRLKLTGRINVNGGTITQRNFYDAFVEVRRVKI